MYFRAIAANRAGFSEFIIPPRKPALPPRLAPARSARDPKPARALDT